LDPIFEQAMEKSPIAIATSNWSPAKKPEWNDEIWERGWKILFGALEPLNDADLTRTNNHAH